MNENDKLARDVKAWRSKGGFTAESAAKVLGIPKRTYEGIEQGRGFPYPKLLRVALESKNLSLEAMIEVSPHVKKRR
ncbi:helix-turn-helix domain-containing protein [Mesorhizobium sp. M0761]|uniref:helix-turn-helix domain-containing protein n=1 Tax=unclassified Mesorhizobium TaxID=325217 RepID=UPI000A034816|nr:MULTISPECIES: helix-turn-helix domain-containing protein [unclassified Mesorhizobium]